ncbi:MAG: hypothetical protein INF65_00410 [Roseomonas sp.]|nr:hypothetical protein [Roseomonas sp.]
MRTPLLLRGFDENLRTPLLLRGFDENLRTTLLLERLSKNLLLLQGAFLQHCGRQSLLRYPRFCLNCAAITLRCGSRQRGLSAQRRAIRGGFGCIRPQHRNIGCWRLGLGLRH